VAARSIHRGHKPGVDAAWDSPARAAVRIGS
jgi:hypothetical protein